MRLQHSFIIKTRCLKSRANIDPRLMLKNINFVELSFRPCRLKTKLLPESAVNLYRRIFSAYRIQPAFTLNKNGLFRLRWPWGRGATQHISALEMKVASEKLLQPLNFWLKQVLSRKLNQKSFLGLLYLIVLCMRLSLSDGQTLTIKFSIFVGHIKDKI